jgi:hypothetical protein
MNTTLAAPSPKASKRRGSTRKPPPSYISPSQSQETHDAALHAIRNLLKGRTSYDAFPVSFRLIVLDTKLNVKKALQCLLLNGNPSIATTRLSSLVMTGVVSAPLWNSEKSKFAGMLTVLDIIHLIQYYYDTANYEAAAADVETFRLESIRGTHAGCAGSYCQIDQLLPLT